MEAQGVRCPMCGQIDSVQKVSSIVHDATSYGEASGVGGRTCVTMYNKSQTVLRGQLALPELNVDLLNRFKGVGLVTLCLGIPFQLCFLAFMLGINWQSPIDPLLYLYTSGFTLFGLLFFVPALIFKRLKIAKDRPKREHAEEVWERLYYCYRDDVVFIPGSSTKHCIPASKVRGFLGY